MKRILIVEDDALLDKALGGADQGGRLIGSIS